jgi:hypothetical protein
MDGWMGLGRYGIRCNRFLGGMGRGGEEEEDERRTCWWVRE